MKTKILYVEDEAAWRTMVMVFLSRRHALGDLLLHEPRLGIQIRGGSWLWGPGRCRSANWANRQQSDSFSYVGFRVARNAG
jgi:formylglycine-generating enzyme required for sulfatase activity